MKRVTKLLAALLVVVLCFSSLAALASGTVRTTGSVNLRKGPGLDYKTIRSISSGVKLNYDKTSKDDRGVVWYRVKYKGKTGWVSSKYAKEGSGSSSSSSGSSSSGSLKTTGSLHLRKGPGLDYKSIQTIGSGTKLSYDKTSKDDRGVVWYRVTYKGKTGWVSSKYAKTSGSGSSGSGGSASVGNKVRTTANVHLRTGAGTDYEVLRTVPTGTTLTCEETKKDGNGNRWYRVSYQGKMGWIFAKYTRKQ